jgi:hypothetical protein
MSMSDYSKVAHATERIREEAFHRMLGRDEDARFDPIFDSLLDLYDDLASGGGDTAAGLPNDPEGGTRPETAAGRAS